MNVIKRNGSWTLFLLLYLCLACNGQASSFLFNWKQLNPVHSPAARRFATMAFDPSRGQIILFGGYNGQFLNDTWAYDGKANEWINLAPSHSPPSRAGAAMAFDQATGQMIVFGGYNGRYLQDIWGYDAKANRWVDLTPTLPPPFYPSAREFASMAFDPLIDRLILFGGENGRELKDTWLYDAKTNRWTNVTPSVYSDYPSARYGAAMVFDPRTNQVILVGGGNEEWSFNDTWAYNSKIHAWRRLDPKSPPIALEFAALALDRTSGQLILFGGSDGDVAYGGTWKYDTQANTWELLNFANPSPSDRYGASMAYDSSSGQLVLFGGKNSDYFGDTWALRAKIEITKKERKKLQE